MPTLKLKMELSQELFEQLLDVAHRECRPTVFQAEWLLRRAIMEAWASVETEDRAPCRAGAPAPQAPADTSRAHT